MKQRALAPGVVTNQNIIIYVVIVGKGVQQKMGEVEIEFDGIICKLHVVQNSFQVDRDGIVGIIFGPPFLYKNKAIINFIEPANNGITLNKKNFIPFKKFHIKIPARTRKKVSISVQKTDNSKKYLRIDAGPGILRGQVLVRQTNIFVINTTHENGS